MLILQHSVNSPILTVGLKDFKFAFIGRLGNFQNNQGEPLVGKGVKNNQGMHKISYIEFQGAQSLNSLNCSVFILVLEMKLKKSLFSDLFLNSEFLTMNFQVTAFVVAPCLDLLFVIKYYFNSAKDNLNNKQSRQVTVTP